MYRNKTNTELLELFFLGQMCTNSYAACNGHCGKQYHSRDGLCRFMNKCKYQNTSCYRHHVTENYLTPVTSHCLPSLYLTVLTFDNYELDINPEELCFRSYHKCTDDCTKKYHVKNGANLCKNDLKNKCRNKECQYRHLKDVFDDLDRIRVFEKYSYQGGVYIPKLATSTTEPLDNPVTADVTNTEYQTHELDRTSPTGVTCTDGNPQSGCVCENCDDNESFSCV